ncbi:TIGR03086 family protein [Occultella glacieicola]|uniref:TIGR03086 family protein n=1 Tax=Occultella glacieicola TaxID=2518684 RepID=A0ABY2E5X2_9MICO|nr:TIGR03086 family metal-binding protein [Occultella glacieicola]TDE94896.1 TIGR03086 family protein [Occultella glacieicola]
MTSTATAPRTDPRPLLARALDQTGALIAGTEVDQSSLPTPCDEFDVAALVGHLQGVVRRIGVVLEGRPFHEAPSHVDSTDWVGDWESGRAATDAVLADDESLTRTVTVPWGQVPGAAAVGSYLGELTVHAWDLAAATGRTDGLDGGLAEIALAAYERMLPAEPRGGDVPFGDPVPVPADADPYARLVAWTGRDPFWTAG